MSDGNGTSEADGRRFVEKAEFEAFRREIDARFLKLENGITGRLDYLQAGQERQAEALSGLAGVIDALGKKVDVATETVARVGGFLGRLPCTRGGEPPVTSVKPRKAPKKERRTR